jgi:UDP-N-acetylmuramoyl-tripeptide--D-alanyl-D-alanine ligase
MQAVDFQLFRSEGTWGANFKVHFRGTVVPFFLPNALGKPAVYTALAAAAVGTCFDINLATASEVLRSYEPPAGRLRLLSGIKQTVILDDTYNAAPASVIAAMEVLHQIAAGRKIMAIGSMTELGEQAEQGHRQVAAKIMEIGSDLIFLVGEETKIILDELSKRGYQDRVFWFASADEARLPIQDAIRPADTVLVKGSQAVRMEKIVKEIMNEPMRSDQLLVRQTGDWAQRP